MRWYILTGEYPPSPGGVSDYTQQVAEGLAARGETVTVCAPAGNGRGRRQKERNGAGIEWLPGHFGWRGLRALRAFLNSEPPGGRLLVQYVPHAFGWKAMNVPLCAWLASQQRHNLWVMFHEVAYPLRRGQPWRYNLLARVNHWMARRLAIHARRVFISTTAWLPLLETVCRRAIPGDCAAIPSNFEKSELGVGAQAPPWAGNGRGPILGHFGTFSPWSVSRLGPLIPAVLAACPEARFVLLGRGSETVADRFRREHPALQARIFGSGPLSKAAVPTALAACDLLIQLYADGINTRRTSAMCGLALGRPVVTSAGANTEPVWRESAGVMLVESDAPEQWAAVVRQLLDFPVERRALGERGAALYWTRFSLEKTLDLLLDHPVADHKPSPRAC